MISKDFTISEKKWVKDISKKMKRQTPYWEKIFVIHINKKTNSPIKILTQDLNGYFIKEDKIWTNQHMQRCLTSLVIRENQFKATMRYHYMLNA